MKQASFVNQHVLRALSAAGQLEFAKLQESTKIEEKELRGATMHLCALGLILREKDTFSLSAFGRKLVEDIGI